MENTKIQWAHHTFNCWIGCTKVSEGCANCYAEEQMDRRYHKVEWGKGKPRVKTGPAYWKKPPRWNRVALANGVRQRVFCASLADVWDEEVPLAWRVELWTLILKTPWLDWMLLTKRPENIQGMMAQLAQILGRSVVELPNVWLGASVESPDYLCRLEALLQVPAVIHFASFEPLLARLGPALLPHLDARSGRKIKLAIVGGESGHQARELFIPAATEIVNYCWVTRTACFVKQLGDNPVDEMVDGDTGETRRVPMPLLTTKGGEPSEWPAHLRVRQIPDPGIYQSPGRG